MPRRYRRWPGHRAWRFWQQGFRPLSGDVMADGMWSRTRATYSRAWRFDYTSRYYAASPLHGALDALDTPNSIWAQVHIGGPVADDIRHLQEQHRKFGPGDRY